MIKLNKKEKKKKYSFKIKEFLDLTREPVETYCITPNLSPEGDDGFDNFINQFSSYDKGKKIGRKTSFKDDGGENKTGLILNAINSIFREFYIPNDVRFSKNGIKIKLSDLVSFKIVVENKTMLFYLTVPKKWSESFVSAIKKDWNNVEIFKVDEGYIDFNKNNAKAMEVYLRNHYSLAIKHSNSSDSFYSTLSSLATTMTKEEKMMIDMQIKPVNDVWKEKSKRKIKEYKDGKLPVRDGDYTPIGIFFKVFDVINVVFDEFVRSIEDIMETEKRNDKKEAKKELPKLEYSDKKTFANSKGYSVKINVLAEANETKRVNHILKNVESAFTCFDGDNKFVCNVVKTKKGFKKVLNTVEMKSVKTSFERSDDIFYNDELSEMLKIPSRTVLEENKKIIKHDSYSRTEIEEDFFKESDSSIPFAKTLDKENKRISLGGYERDWWTDKGRFTKYRNVLDDRSVSTMIFGGQGGGKTSQAISQSLYTFGVHLFNKYKGKLSEDEILEKWKHESKSVVVFDVADGEMISNIYNRIPHAIRDRVVILNHNNNSRPIAVNNADLSEYNKKSMKDRNYSRVLAEMEGSLINNLLNTDKSISMDRYFITALQCVHEANDDFGFVEAIRMLTDSNFRNNEILPLLKNRKSIIEINKYNALEESGKFGTILQTIDNRLAQLESDTTLWNSIAQKPMRNEEGSTSLNFRKFMDGDEGGAYLVLIYIPKTNVSEMFRKYVFAHYFTKIWNVALSRENGFAGREYRPETLVVIDEVHQIIDIPLVARLFIDLFKEPRKYSLRFLFTLHGWSSFSNAPKGVKKDIEQSIMDNGCNLIFLKGGEDSFKSFNHLLEPMTLADFNNLKNLEYCGIFRIAWKNKNHVFQAKLLEHIGTNKDFSLYSDYESGFLSSYISTYSRDCEEVENDILDRSEPLLSNTLENIKNNGGEELWEEVRNLGMQEMRKIE